MTEEELKKAIFTDPEDCDAWVAYGEYLTKTGDIRGELIALELSGGSDRIHEIISRNKDLWCGPELTELLSVEEPKKTIFGRVADFFTGRKEPPLDLEWKYGFVKSAKVKNRRSGNLGDPVQCLNILLNSPSSEFMSQFSIDFMGGYDESTAGILTAFEGRNMRALRKVHLGDFEYPDENEISWVHIGNVNRAFLLFPFLEEMHLRGAEIELGNVSHAYLQSLILETGGLPEVALESVMTAKLPSLEKLEMWTGDVEFGSEGTIDMVQPLLKEILFPKLKNLALKNCDFVDEFTAHLVNTPILKQLEILDLSMGTLSDDGARVFIIHYDQFKHLKLIDLEDNFTSSDICNELTALYGEKIRVSEQTKDDHDGERYVTVGE